MSFNNLQPEWQIYNRVYLVQIVHTDARQGTVDVVCPELPAFKRSKLEMPWSVSLAKHKSAWNRYMPQRGDLFWLGFGPNNEPRLLGPASRPGRNEGANLTRESNLANQIPYGDLVDLKPGEWDMRSSGGAYLHGSRDGVLRLSGGPLVRLVLDKSRSEAMGESGMWELKSSGSFWRLGQVKRIVPNPASPLSAFAETDVSALDPAAQREAHLHIESPTAPLTALALVDEEWGTVRLPLGPPLLSLQGQAVRHRKRVWPLGTVTSNPVAIPAYTSTIDALGNTSIVSPTATNLDVAVPFAATTVTNAGTALTSSGAISLAATGSTSITGSIVSLNSPTVANGVLLGSLAAASHVPRGELLLEALNAQALAINAASVALGAAVTALQGLPINLPIAPALAAAVTALGALSATTTALAASTFIPGSPVLSTKVAVE